jgi:hypothetical protein
MLLQFEVGGPDQVGGFHIDEPVAQDVGPEQDLARAALEVAQVKLGAGRPVWSS